MANVAFIGRKVFVQRWLPVWHAAHKRANVSCYTRLPHATLLRRPRLGLHLFVEQASLAVWKADKLIVLAEKDELKDALEALEIPVRCGKRFELYLVDEDNIVQVDLEHSKA